MRTFARHRVFLWWMQNVFSSNTAKTIQKQHHTTRVVPSWEPYKLLTHVRSIEAAEAAAPHQGAAGSAGLSDVVRHGEWRCCINQQFCSGPKQVPYWALCGSRVSPPAGAIGGDNG